MRTQKWLFLGIIILLIGCSRSSELAIVTEPVSTSAASIEAEPVSTAAASIEDPIESISLPPLDPTYFSESRPEFLLDPSLAPPNFELIKLEHMGDGRTKVVGLPGALPGSYLVCAASPNTGSVSRVLSSKQDGSFELDLIAPPGAWVLVKYDPTLNGIAPGEGNACRDQNGHASKLNGLVGSMGIVPYEITDGEGVDFVISGTFNLIDDQAENKLDYSISGSMIAGNSPGENIVINGRITVYPNESHVSSLIGRSLSMELSLLPLFNDQGLPRVIGNDMFSTILTPSGLPIEYSNFIALRYYRLIASGLSLDENGKRLSGSFSNQFAIPSTLREGTYALWLSEFNEEIPSGFGKEGFRIKVSSSINLGNQALPPFTIGSPSQPRLAMSMLTDYPRFSASRGTISEEDRDIFELSSRIAMQSKIIALPLISKETGDPLHYRLEPYFPMIAHGDRVLANAPYIRFAFPSGSLRVVITDPEGNIDILGPSPFTQGQARTPVSSGGLLLDNGGGNLGDVFQLGTGNPAFDYQFSTYGEHTIEVEVSVEDVYGNDYVSSGTYRVIVAEEVDIEPGTLPMTPLEVGDAFNPSLTLLPGIPADVSVRVTHYPNSQGDDSRVIEITGEANRFGVFSPDVGTSPILFEQEGEYLVEIEAHHVDDTSKHWFGSLRWGQVVASPDTSLIAHGRRGRDDTPIHQVKLWFLDPHTEEQTSHVFFPYASGDILWQTDEDAAIVVVSVQDASGEVAAKVNSLVSQGYYQGYESQRNVIGEIPLSFSTTSARNGSLYPEDINVFGYWYGGVERPGERVREIVSARELGTSYWRFGELYALQPGIGSLGDIENDIKFLFGGAVFRDELLEKNYYGIYGSLWVNVGERDALGTRVFPPFQGVNGGPSGGPILVLDDQEIDAFIVPLSVKTGTILEAGDTFSFSGQLAPTLPGQVAVSILGPNGFSKTFLGRANKVGYFYDPENDLVLNDPGIYEVNVTITFDLATSAGPMVEPFPVGSTLGSIDETFEIFVVSPENPKIISSLPVWSVARSSEVPIVIGTPTESEIVEAHYVVGMPGYRLDGGTISMEDGLGKVIFNSVRLRSRFPNLEQDSRYDYDFGLSDTVWVSVILEAISGEFYAQNFTIQGPDVYAIP